METPRTPAGNLTDHIMAALPELENYNAIYIAVLGALNDADSAGIAIVPDNDHALMAVITNWPVAKRKRFYQIVGLVCEEKEYRPMFLKEAPVKIGGWASVSYQCECRDCDQQFIGDKRAIFCLPCAHAFAIKAEREACAKAVEDFGHSNGKIRASHKHAARAIRERA